MMILATFKFVYFPVNKKYVGIAWNYDEAILISTDPCDSYNQAKMELSSTCNSLNVDLRWFDGEYEYDNGGQIITRKFEDIYYSHKD